MRIVLLVLAALLFSGCANAAQYALVNGLDEIVDSREFATTPPDLQATEGVRWLPYVDTNPPHDPVTQVKTGPVISVGASEVTRVWTVRDKTAQELDDDRTAEVDSLSEPAIKGMLDTHNAWRVSVSLPVITEAQFRANLKTFIGSDPPPPDTSKVAILKGTGAPTTILKFSANVTIGSISAATSTDKTFTVAGLLTTDTILSVTFISGLTPTTISYTPLRVSAANMLAIRFSKISTGSVTPPANQAIEVMVAR